MIRKNLQLIPDRFEFTENGQTLLIELFVIFLEIFEIRVCKHRPRFSLFRSVGCLEHIRDRGLLNHPRMVKVRLFCGQHTVYPGITTENFFRIQNFWIFLN